MILVYYLIDLSVKFSITHIHYFRPISTFRSVAAHPNANTSATVQITIQQPRTGAPLLSQLAQQPKPVPLSHTQPVVAGSQVVPQKLTMSQATVAPIIHSATTNPQKIGKSPRSY